MLRRPIVITVVAGGVSVAAVSLATPALAKGPSQASITGPGLVRAIVVSGEGEPGQQGTLAVLAGQTGLFTALFGADITGIPETPTSLRTPPPKAALGPRYTISYTVPGVTPQPGEQFGRIRQDLYPDAAGGPVIYTPPGQDGFSQPLQVTGWLRASPLLTRTLTQLGIPLRPVTPASPPTRPSAVPPAAAHQTGSQALAWLIAAAVAIGAAALAGAVLRRRRKPAIAHGTETQSQRTGSGVGLAGGCPASHSMLLSPGLRPLAGLRIRARWGSRSDSNAEPGSGPGGDPGRLCRGRRPARRAMR
jgi:LPXTG-motif cell wall-anchored protein